MIVGLGADLLDVEQMERELRREGGGFRDDVFTPAEVSYCGAKAFPARHYAARFAAKEAFWKAVGSGPEPVSLRDVEVVRTGSGAPRLVLRGGAGAAAKRLGVTSTFVTMTHTAALASASVVLEGEPATGKRRDG